MSTYILLAVVTGALGAVHVPINGALGERIQSSVVATFAFYGVAFLLMSLLCVIRDERQAFRGLLDAPRWYLVAGVISVVVVGTSTYLIPRLGAVNLFVIFVSAQLVVRMMLSHYGWLESPVNPISPSKLAGAVLLLTGVILVVRE